MKLNKLQVKGWLVGLKRSLDFYVDLRARVSWGFMGFVVVAAAAQVRCFLFLLVVVVGHSGGGGGGGVCVCV